MPYPSLRRELPALGLWLWEWMRLELKNGVLYQLRNEQTQMKHQLMLPVELRPIVLKSLHDDLGHLGIEQTLNPVRSRFYWPKMSLEVEQKIKICEQCLSWKTLPHRAAVEQQLSNPLLIIQKSLFQIQWSPLVYGVKAYLLTQVCWKVILFGMNPLWRVQACGWRSTCLLRSVI